MVGLFCVVFGLLIFFGVKVEIGLVIVCEVCCFNFSGGNVIFFYGKS